MGNYSGKASFQFDIERFRNLHTQELFPLDEVKDKEGNKLTYQQVDQLDDYEYLYLSLQVEGNSYFQRGRYTGPIDSSFPDEGETNITSIIGPDGKDWEDKLTQSEKDSILEMIEEQSQGELDYDDYDDCGE